VASDELRPVWRKTGQRQYPWLFNIQDIADTIPSSPSNTRPTWAGRTSERADVQRIAPLSDRRSLESPLLDLLGVKYVVTTDRIDVPGYTLAYDDLSQGGRTRIYQNQAGDAPRLHPSNHQLLADQ